MDEPAGHGEEDPQGLAAWLRGALAAAGLSHLQVAKKIKYDRSVVTRAVSGSVATWDLTRRIAAECGADLGETRRRWDAADQARQRAADRMACGWPPPGLHDHAAFCGALRDLLADSGFSQRDLVQPERNHGGVLKRSTVGAVLRAERGATHHVVMAIVRACGVSGPVSRAWEAEWRRLAQPDLDARHKRRREGLKARERASYGNW